MDPIIIVRSNSAINDKWLLQFRGDVGGFGLVSDFTWQVQANVGYQFSKLVSATIGYRVLDVDYDKGDGTEHFAYGHRYIWSASAHRISMGIGIDNQRAPHRETSC